MVSLQADVSIKGIDTTFRTTNRDGSHTVIIGDLYAEEKKDILVKLQVC